MKPLEGIIVLDMTRVLAGPYCTMMLSDLGARVIKVEQPGIGDDSRHFGPYRDGQSGYFLSINRGKESITLNLKKPEGVEILKRFVKKADVLVENFRPGTMEKLGIGYDELKKINPRLIYAASSGFGHSGPWSKKPAYDMIVQAAGGIMSITGWPDAPPTRVGASIGDIIAALFADIGILTALYQRNITGEGQKVDVAMLDSQVAILENALVRYAFEGTIPGPLGTRHPTITPFQAFKTADSWLIVAVGNDKLWEQFCNATNAKDLFENPDFATNKLRCENYDKLIPVLEKRFSEKPCADWEAIFEKHAIPNTKISNVADLFKNEQLQARNMFVTVDDKHAGKTQIAGNPVKLSSMKESGTRMPPPELGEHTESVLKNLLEFTGEEIENFKKSGAI